MRISPKAPSLKQRAEFRRRAQIARAVRSRVVAPVPGVDAAATPVSVTLPQTIVLLALSRGEKPPVSHVGTSRNEIPPITRQSLLRARYITPRPHEITDAGRRALATSPHLSAAIRALDK